ncbi:MAG: hypothetical protein Q9164_002108 [Protoblastenia rupestris]
MTNFTIAITSDTVCPWCFIGKRHLEAGIALYKSTHPERTNDTFTTTWLPYQLNPTAPKIGIDKREYYIQKFGAEKVALMFPRLEAVGTRVGINFNFGGKTGNTRDSHRLIEMAKGKGGAVLQDRVVEEFFKMYFQGEGDITDHETLTRAAVRAGMLEGDVRRCLESDEGGKEVDREVEVARRRGISGVPHFVVQDRYEIGGAQDAEAFVRVFKRVEELERS